jgi:4-carboxymuconolactone decarboxylase
MSSSTYEKGLKLRKEVLGTAHVERSMANMDDFTKPLQEVVTEIGWGQFWTRPGLTRKERSLITLGVLAALGRPHELAVHTKGAINNGCTKDEIREALIHVGCYAGFPATIDAFRSAKKALDEMEADAKK